MIKPDDLGECFKERNVSIIYIPKIKIYAGNVSQA